MVLFNFSSYNLYFQTLRATYRCYTGMFVLLRSWESYVDVENFLRNHTLRWFYNDNCNSKNINLSHVHRHTTSTSPATGSVSGCAWSASSASCTSLRISLTARSWSTDWGFGISHYRYVLRGVSKTMSLSLNIINWAKFGILIYPSDG